MGDPVRLKRTFDGDRVSLRTSVVRAFLKEKPGTGRRHLCSRYIYEVETSASGHTIELHRPAYLNKGIDFTVRCQSLRFNTSRNPWPTIPRHKDLVRILHNLQQQYPARYNSIRNAIIRAYRCEPLGRLRHLSKMRSAPVSAQDDGCPADAAALIAKWLFAEQDVTYWHNSGRAMLFEKLRDEGLV